ncbi:MAG: hypothetical protein E7354_04485 [Clostridiales bacterium]|nr:hypothetical protein [Clostridiales bacterium]
MIKAYGCIDIVIRRDSLEKKEKGLSQKFIEEYGVKEPHFDNDLICIPGGMNPYDVGTEVTNLEEKYGLVYNPNIKEGPITDIIIVEPLGMSPYRSWLRSKIIEESDICRGIVYYLEGSQEL